MHLADLGAEPVELCPRTTTQSEIHGNLKENVLVLTTNCLDQTGEFTSNEIALQLTHSYSNTAVELINVHRYDLLELQGMVISAIDFKSYDISLHSGKTRCRGIGATPLREPPLPRGVMDDRERWFLALGFLVSPDCSLAVIYAGNQATILEPGDKSPGHLYNLSVHWKDGERG